MARVTLGYGLLIVVCIFLATPAWAARVCSECGAANPDENNFCEACGSPLKPMVTCPECGAKYPKGTVSCTCGYVFLKPKTVTVTVTPAKATIYVNGVERGKGRAEVTLEAGETARVEGRLKGYDAVTRNIGYDGATSAIRLTLAKAITTKPTLPKAPRRESFWDSDVLLWGTVGLAAACFGYGYYNDREAADVVRLGNESTDPWEIEFYRNEVDKYERRRNASYIAGGGVACGAAYFGARRVFFAIDRTATVTHFVVGIAF